MEAYPTPLRSMRFHTRDPVLEQVDDELGKAVYGVLFVVDTVGV